MSDRSTDELFAKATVLAADELLARSRAGAAIGEKRDLQPVMRQILASLTSDVVDVSEVTLSIADWKPTPKGLDIGIRRSGSATPHVAAELKLRDIDQTLWDLYKMLAARRLDGVEAAYLIAGTSGWDVKPNRCAELFQEDGLESYPSVRLFEDNPLAWYWLLKGGSARPLSIPAAVTTCFVSEASIKLDQKPASLRCIKVEATAQEMLPFSSRWFCGDWPVGVQPPDRYLAWKGLNRE